MQKNQKFLAFDIGGTKIACAVINERGKILSETQKFDTPKTTDAINLLLKSIISQHEDEIDAVAIATAGEVSNERSRIISSVGNMAAGYRDTDFASLSAKPVILENDANAAAWAEYKLGAGKYCKNLLVVAIGTGVGLGVIVDGKLLKGKCGAAAEAHFPINRGNKRRCSCGAYDCYEIYASGTALSLDAKEAYGNDTKNSHDVIKGIKGHDHVAIDIFDNWQNNVLAGIYGLVNLFDPEAVILFGSLVEFMDVEKLEREANQIILTPPVKICCAKHGANAAMIGATLLAAEELKKNSQRE